jgi:hypothetical protein
LIHFEACKKIIQLYVKQ